MPGDMNDELVVVRFTPFGETSLNNSVTKQVIGDEIKKRTPKHGVSVFADRMRDGEDLSAAVDRICLTVRLHAGGDRIAVTTEQALNNAGYCLHKVVPPELHYLVGGNDLHSPPPNLSVLADIFTKDRRKNAAFEKGTGK